MLIVNLAGLPIGDIVNVPGDPPAILEAGLDAQEGVYVNAFTLIY